MSDYFELFQLPRRFRLDADALRQTWHRLQQASHPDQFVDAAANERSAAMDKSLAINAAYRTLSAPVSRAWYLITLAGGDEAALRRLPLPFEFLENQIAWREEIAELTTDASSMNALSRLKRELATAREALIAELDALFEPPAFEITDSLVASVLRLQFIEKTRAELKETEARLLDDF